MKRLPDWEARLRRFLESVQAKPFKWGEHDCCLMVCEAVGAMTAADLTGGFRGEYDTEEGAKEFMRTRFGTESLEAVAETVSEGCEMKPVPVLEVEPGDVVVLRHSRPMLGIVDLSREMIAALSDKGLLHVPKRFALRAWRI